MPSKSYVVVRPFDRQDSQTGENTRYEAGEPYAGPDIEKYLAWPGGPLITAAPEAPAADDRSAEK